MRIPELGDAVFPGREKVPFGWTESECPNASGVNDVRTQTFSGRRGTYPFRECQTKADFTGEACNSFGAQPAVKSFTDNKGWYPGFEGRQVGWDLAWRRPVSRYPRVIRGGGFESDPADCRSAARLGRSAVDLVPPLVLPGERWPRVRGGRGRGPVHAHVQDFRPRRMSGKRNVVDAEHYLRHLVEVVGSDLHLKAGSPPTIRVSGNLQPLDAPTVMPDLANELAMALLTTDREKETLEANGEVDFAYSMAGLGRFRVNVHRQRGSLGVAARRILPGAPNSRVRRITYVG